MFDDFTFGNGYYSIVLGPWSSNSFVATDTDTVAGIGPIKDCPVVKWSHCDAVCSGVRV